MAESFGIRSLEPGDLEHLWVMNWDPLPREIKTFYLLCTIARPRFSSVATDSAGRIVGVLLTTTDENLRWLYVNHLHVEGACRGGGVGSALMRNLEAQCKAAGLGRIWLLTSGDLETYYGRMGFVRNNTFMPPITRELMARHRPETLILSKTL